MSEECEFDCDPSGPNNDVHAGRCPIYLEARIAALESSLRERDVRITEIEKAYRERALGELWTLLPERSHGYHDIVRFVQQATNAALSPAPAAKEDAHGCGLCGHNHPTSTHTAPGGRLL